MKRLLLLALPFALAACARPPQNETPPPAPAAAPARSVPSADAGTLSAYHWHLTDARNAQGQRIDALFAQADKPLTLDFAKGRVSVGNTCNRMGGGYSVAGGTLVFGRLASTLMACPDSRLMALDQEAGKRLQGALAFALRQADTPQLTLTSAAGDVLRFAGQATAETRYGGPGERAFLEVAAQTRPCNHPLIPDKQCLQVRELSYDAQGAKTAAGEWQNFYEGIEGYTHEDGVRNVLRVKRFTRNPVPADTSASVYVLDMVVESEVVKK